MLVEISENIRAQIIFTRTLLIADIIYSNSKISTFLSNKYTIGKDSYEYIFLNKVQKEKIFFVFFSFSWEKKGTEPELTVSDT